MNRNVLRFLTFIVVLDVINCLNASGILKTPISILYILGYLMIACILTIISQVFQRNGKSLFLGISTWLDASVSLKKNLYLEERIKRAGLS